jgi:hypothetical protein
VFGAWRTPSVIHDLAVHVEISVLASHCHPKYRHHFLAETGQPWFSDRFRLVQGGGRLCAGVLKLTAVSGNRIDAKDLGNSPKIFHGDLILSTLPLAHRLWGDAERSRNLAQNHPFALPRLSENTAKLLFHVGECHWLSPRLSTKVCLVRKEKLCFKTGMPASPHIDPALLRALQNAGGATAIARALGITPQAVGQWRKVPAERVIELERVSGVPRHDLRPDLYPREEVTAA